MIAARYTTAARDAVSVRMDQGDTLGGVTGPADIALRMPAPGNREHDELMALIAKGRLAISDYVSPPVAVPDNPTLRDWRVGLLLWGRLAEVSAKVADLIASGDPMGGVARESLEYANNVLRAQLLQLRGVFGFSEAEIDESLWRASRVAQGDLSGRWPLAAEARKSA